VSPSTPCFAPFGTGHQSSDRRAVNDGATPLLEHLPQLELHATPHAAKIDGNHAVKVFSGGIGSFHSDVLDAGIVVGRIEPPERSHRPLNHTFYLSIVPRSFRSRRKKAKRWTASAAIVATTTMTAMMSHKGIRSICDDTNDIHVLICIPPPMVCGALLGGTF
jgi:hypothetical protein